MIDATCPTLMSTVFEASVDAMVVASQDSEIIRANASAARLFGYKGSALMGQSINDLMPAHMADKHDAFVQDYLKTGVDQIIGTRRPVEGLRRDGTTFPLQSSVSKAEYGWHHFLCYRHS